MANNSADSDVRLPQTQEDAASSQMQGQISKDDSTLDEIDAAPTAADTTGEHSDTGHEAISSSNS